MTAPSSCNAISPNCSRRRAEPAVLDYLDSIKGADVASLLDHGREVLGQVRGGGLIPLSMTMGRTQADGPNFFAVFRDLSQTRKSESELQQARRLADRAANAKARHAGADQPRGPHAAQRHHRLCRSDDRRTLRRARQRALRRIHEGHPRLGRARDRHHQRSARPVSRIETGKLDLSLRQPEPQRSGRAMRRGDAAAGQPRTHHHPHLARAYAAAGAWPTPARCARSR